MAALLPSRSGVGPLLPHGDTRKAKPHPNPSPEEEGREFSIVSPELRVPGTSGSLRVPGRYCRAEELQGEPLAACGGGGYSWVRLEGWHSPGTCFACPQARMRLEDHYEFRG